MMVKQLGYGATAKVFHWLVAGLLAIQVPLGLLMPDIRRSMPPGNAMILHVSIGISILLVIILRFLWRLMHPVAPEGHLPAWQRVISETVHWLLYAAVVMTTITGWFFESASGWKINLFGVVPLQNLVAEGSPLGRSLGSWHVTLVWILLSLIAVHILAALVHLLVYKDRVIYRMLPSSA